MSQEPTQNSSNYWNNFYKTYGSFCYEPSTFCQFTIDYLKNNKINPKILDLGCGNCRDLLYFKKEGYDIDGVDSSIEICNHIKEQYNISLKCDNLVEFINDHYDLYYFRFVVHALSYEDCLKLVNKLNILKSGSLVFIETRSIKGSSYENENYYETNFKSGIGECHNRTLFNIEYLKSLFETNFNIIYEKDDNNLSEYKGENPYLIRLILVKK